MIDPIEQAKEATRMAMGRFLRTFEKVPDDKLTWSPAPTAKSALRIAAHTGVSSRWAASVLRGEKSPADDIPGLIAIGEAAQAQIRTREQAVALIEAARDEMLAALEQVDPAQLGAVVKTPLMSAPMSAYLNLVPSHTLAHAAQIDYLQTIWGDMGFYF